MEIFKRSYIGTVVDNNGFIHASSKASSGVKVAEILAEDLTGLTMEDGADIPPGSQIRIERVKTFGPLQFNKKLLGVLPIK